MKNKLFYIIVFIAALLFSVTTARAISVQETAQLNIEEFSMLPILHEGRVQPIASMAQTTLQRLSGEDHLEIKGTNISAQEWLAITLFDPQSTAALPVILIESKLIKEKFGLPPQQKHFSFLDLKPSLDQTKQDVIAALAKPQESLSDEERALIELHEKSATLTLLMRSFSALLPLDLVLPEQMRNEIAPPYTFLKIAPYEPGLTAAVQKIVASKGRDINTYSYDETNAAQTAFQIAALRSGGENNALFKVIPGTWADNKDEWHSPWQTILQGQGSPESAFLLSQWEELATAYRTQNAELWNAVIDDIKQETAIQSEIDITKLEVESSYKNIAPYKWITGLFAAALLLLTLGAYLKKNEIYNAAIISASLATIGLITTLGARLYILERAPLGTLYETILFVACICALTAAAALFFAKRKILFPIGVSAALTLLLIAPFFAQGGETLEVLGAVLNTNFWLATHVLLITSGYGICIITALLAHAALGINAFSKSPAKALELQKLTHQFSILALLLTVIGTILGGIWADQSWGRFWGWDPKENGALLIVLWLIWAQHGRLSGKIIGNIFLIVMAALNIVVAISWFGVNLLGVGLHSYGFTTGVLAGLLVFIAVQTIIIGALYIKARKTAP